MSGSRMLSISANQVKHSVFEMNAYLVIVGRNNMKNLAVTQEMMILACLY